MQRGAMVIEAVIVMAILLVVIGTVFLSLQNTSKYLPTPRAPVEEYQQIFIKKIEQVRLIKLMKEEQ